MLDDQCLADTTDLHDMITAVIRSALVDEAFQAGLRTRLEEMRQRLVRLEERGAKKRQMALEAWQKATSVVAIARVGMWPVYACSSKRIDPSEPRRSG
jgi:hypothetical protein